ncbi:MAG: helix-turn-helix domain-containing protein, partial [Sulfuricella sp.]|nr:helix-turn-helix domain-containing protein [Sulfuricella sp.]
MGKTNNIFISLKEGCALLGVDRSTLQRQIKAEKYPVVQVKSNGGQQYRIPLSSLPQSAQHTYLMKLAREESDRMADPKVQAELWNAETLELARKDAAAGKPPRKIKLRPVPVDQDELNTVWTAFENAPKKAKQKAQQAMAALIL